MLVKNDSVILNVGNLDRDQGCLSIVEEAKRRRAEVSF